MKHFYQKFLVVIFISGLVVTSSAQGFLCYFNPWELKTCKATVTFNDGSVTDFSFSPDTSIAIPTCWAAGCHPANCSGWQKAIRKGCKKAWNEKMYDLVGRAGKRVEDIQKVAFDGCAEMPPPKSRPLLVAMDWIMRTFASTRFYVVCSNDPGAEKWLATHAYEAAYTKFLQGIGALKKGKETALEAWERGVELAGPKVEKGKKTAKQLYADIRKQINIYTDKYLGRSQGTSIDRASIIGSQSMILP